MGHHATVCKGTQSSGEPPTTVTSPPIKSVVLLSARDTLNRGDRPLDATGNEERSTIRPFAGIATRFHPFTTAPDEVRTVRVAVEYVLAAGEVSLKERHCWMEDALVQDNRGTITGAENSATEGGVVHVEPPVIASIVAMVPLSVFVQMQLAFWVSMVAVYAE